MTAPNWVNDPSLSEEDRKKLLLSYHLRAAALQHNKNGSVKKLSIAAGFSGDYLALSILRGKLAKKAELAVRMVAGAEAFPEDIVI